MTLSYQTLLTPVGELTLVANSKALVAILWEIEKPNRVRLTSTQLDPHHPVLREACRQLTEYFAGKRTQFDLPLEPSGTDFQKKVWLALRQIPFGQTKSYLQIAQEIGSPKAVRAVGAANGRNPISIVVPCHRVIGRNGLLTGFAGGLKAKQILLSIENPKLDQLALGDTSESAAESTDDSSSHLRSRQSRSTLPPNGSRRL